MPNDTEIDGGFRLFARDLADQVLSLLPASFEDLATRIEAQTRAFMHEARLAREAEAHYLTVTMPRRAGAARPWIEPPISGDVAPTITLLEYPALRVPIALDPCAAHAFRTGKYAARIAADINAATKVAIQSGLDELVEEVESLTGEHDQEYDDARWVDRRWEKL